MQVTGYFVTVVRMEWGPRGAELQPAIDALDELSEVRWTEVDPVHFDALWNRLFGLAESSGTLDSDKAATA